MLKFAFTELGLVFETSSVDTKCSTILGNVHISSRLGYQLWPITSTAEIEASRLQ